MTVREAGKYIADLRKKQSDPSLWPDFLTGLPGIGAVMREVKAAYPRLGAMAVSYIRIANIHPYIIKYGPDRHSEIVQWAAAILSTSMSRRKGFVGTVGTHDFVAVCRAKDMDSFLAEVSRSFEKKARSYFSKDDLASGSVLSFERDGRTVKIGFMRLVSSTISEKTSITRENVIPHLASLCTMSERLSV